MSARTHTGLTAELLDYLDSHPDVFVQHPELLAKINIPHTTGKNVASLIERQVKVLRYELDGLRNTIVRMEIDANHHKKLVVHTHGLALELLKASAPQDLFQILCQHLKTYYSADCVLLLIFSRKMGSLTGTGDITLTPGAPHAGLRFYYSSSRLRFMFSELFYRGQPLCGSLQEEHLQALFGGESEFINSTVLLPYAGNGWQQLLVLGSHTENRYSHGLELELLRFINDIVCRGIPAWS